MMTCDDAEVMVTSGEGSDELRAHLMACEACSAFAAQARLALEWAALPTPAPATQARLDALPGAVQAEWTKLQRRRSVVQRVLGYAVAAGFGALVATAALGPTSGSSVASVAKVAAVAEVSQADEGLSWDIAPMDEEPDAVATAEPIEELSFEVPWPSL